MRVAVLLEELWGHESFQAKTAAEVDSIGLERAPVNVIRG